MFWFVLWAVLVVGTLVGGFFLARHVLRSGKALTAELGEAGAVADRLQQRVAELTDQAQAAHPVRPVNLGDRAAAQALRAEATQVMAGRTARRDARREATFRRWLSLSR